LSEGFTCLMSGFWCDIIHDAFLRKHSLVRLAYMPNITLILIYIYIFHTGVYVMF
jgi:hypothetical protein